MHCGEYYPLLLTLQVYFYLSLTSSLQYWEQLDMIPGIYSEVILETYCIVIYLVECSLLHTANVPVDPVLRGCPACGPQAACSPGWL